MEEQPATEPASHTLLVVDDDPATARIVRDWFAGRPVEVLDAADGEAGVRIATDRQPDLILLDLKMPGVDGLSAARQLKSDPKTRNIPVILLTACRETKDKVAAFKAGVDDYVTKPFVVEEIDARISTALRRCEILRGLQGEVQHLNSTKTELEQLLMIDDKTGLYNFREFQRRLKEEWNRATRYGMPLSLVFFDLDHFKEVNDTLGHQAGDRVLREFATLVTGGARSNDIAARYGGEEFAVILPHTEGWMAVRLAERIRAAVKEFVFLEDEKPTRITVSAGVSTFPSTPDIASVDSLIGAADQALYAAKESGRNRTVDHAASAGR